MTTLKSVNLLLDPHLFIHGDSKTLVNTLVINIRTYKDIACTRIIEEIRYEYSLATNLLIKSVWNRKKKQWIREVHEATEEEQNVLFKEYYNEMVETIKRDIRCDDALIGLSFSINDLFGEMKL